MSKRLYIGGSPNLIGGNDDSDCDDYESCHAVGGNIFDDIANGITNGVRMISNVIPVPGAREVGNLIADGGDAMHRILAGGHYGGKGEYKKLMASEKELLNNIKGMKTSYRDIARKLKPDQRGTLYNKIDIEVQNIIRQSNASFDAIKTLLGHISNMITNEASLNDIGEYLGIPSPGVNDAKGLKAYWLAVRHSIAQQFQARVNAGATEEELKRFLYNLIHIGVKAMYKGQETKRPIKLHEHDTKYDSLKPLVEQATQWNLFGLHIPVRGSIKMGSMVVDYGFVGNKFVSVKTGKPLAKRTVDKIVAQEREQQRAQDADNSTGRPTRFARDVARARPQLHQQEDGRLSEIASRYGLPQHGAVAHQPSVEMTKASGSRRDRTETIGAGFY